MASAARILLVAIIFLLPGGSLILAAWAARTAVKNRAWLSNTLRTFRPRPPAA